MSGRDEIESKTHAAPERPVLVHPVEGGYAAEGPGFYVWDEDLGEVIRAVRELTLGSGEVTPTRRMLRVVAEPDVPIVS